MWNSGAYLNENSVIDYHLQPILELVFLFFFRRPSLFIFELVHFKFGDMLISKIICINDDRTRSYGLWMWPGLGTNNGTQKPNARFASMVIIYNKCLFARVRFDTHNHSSFHVNTNFQFEMALDSWLNGLAATIRFHHLNNSSFASEHIYCKQNT